MSKHFQISMIKSIIRIVGSIITLMTKKLSVLAISILVSEIVGIVEEVYESK